MLPDAIGRTIDRIYAAAEGAEPWSAPLGDLHQLLRSRVTSLMQQRRDGGPDVIRASIGTDPADRRAYERYYWTKNFYMQRLSRFQQPGQVVPHEAYVTDREILRSEYYQDFMRGLGVFRVISGMTRRLDRMPIRVAACRSRHDAPFSTNDAKVLELLLVHFQRGLAIHEQLTALAPAHDVAPSDPARARAPFTRAEQAIAERLAAGWPLKAIGADLRIRETTLRTHLRHLFQKTGTRRQAELVAWLCRRGRVR